MSVNNDRYTEILDFEAIFCKALSYFNKMLLPCFAYGFFLTEEDFAEEASTCVIFYTPHSFLFNWTGKAHRAYFLQFFQTSLQEMITRSIYIVVRIR